MTDWSRLSEYIHDYFPEPKYSTQEVRDWASENVPVWDKMPDSDREMIIKDWENFIAPEVEEMIETKEPNFWGRIKRFLKRLF